MKNDYHKTLHKLQIELVKVQKHIIKNNLQVLILIEGRDAAGKDGVIKRITQHLSPRDTRVVALGKPSEKDRFSWYFQRFIPHLPIKQEIVIMNRSWYNRAGVEKVMGYCSQSEYDGFMDTVLDFEELLLNSEILVFKYYLDISKKEQKKRLDDRLKDPLKQWKISPVDKMAQKKWSAYSKARNEMLERTSTKSLPWNIVQADNKKAARINLIKHFISIFKYQNKNLELSSYDKKIISSFYSKKTTQIRLAP